jgi:hypothetical protein
MPRGIYDRKPRTEIVARKMAGVKREAPKNRWESIKNEHEQWIKPFKELPVEVALRYLEDLRIVCSKGGEILNMRINDNTKIKCSGPRCGNDLTGTRPNGMPKWIAKMDFKDRTNPEIFHCLYFCCELCKNEYTRVNMNNAVTDGK